MIDGIPEFGEAKPDVKYILRPGGYLVVRNLNGEIAVVVTPKGFFLPGGGQDHGETLEATAIREGIEECGLHVRISDSLGVADELVGSDASATHFQKRCTFFRANLLLCEGGGEPDHELQWKSAEEADKVLTHKSQSWAVERDSLQKR